MPTVGRAIDVPVWLESERAEPGQRAEYSQFERAAEGIESRWTAFEKDLDELVVSIVDEFARVTGIPQPLSTIQLCTIDDEGMVELRGRDCKAALEFSHGEVSTWIALLFVGIEPRRLHRFELAVKWDLTRSAWHVTARMTNTGNHVWAHFPLKPERDVLNVFAHKLSRNILEDIGDGLRAWIAGNPDASRPIGFAK